MNYFAKIRFYTALISTWLMNLNVFGLSFRKICAPGFNCHGCPWASMSCPVGVFAYSSAIHQIPLLAISTVLAISIFAGRLVCGFICPFGFLQDILNKIPSPKFTIPRFLRYGKYLFLLSLVIVLPWIFGFESSGYLYLPKPKITKNTDGNVNVSSIVRNIGDKAVENPELVFVYVKKNDAATEIVFERKVKYDRISISPGEEKQMPVEEVPNMLSEANLLVSSPQSRPEQIPRYKLYFCTHCPNGTLTASLPGMFMKQSDPGIYASSIFSLRYLILAVFILSAVLISRIFCRVACPLGAIYSVFSKISAFGGVKINSEICINCGKCDKSCPMGLDVRKEVGGPECISCGDCIKICPVKCISRK